MHHLTYLLEEAADQAPEYGVIVYPPGKLQTPQRITYPELRDTARRNARLLGEIEAFRPGSMVLVHLGNHTDNIIWLWSLTYAGCIPVMSTPFAHDEEAKRGHLLNLRSVINGLVCLTREGLREQFPRESILPIHTVENVLSSHPAETGHSWRDAERQVKSNPALLMLTSGSTGQSKAVPLGHDQLLASVAGKHAFHRLGAVESTLNWIAFDHVASVVEIHFHSMFAKVNQVHLHPADAIANPLVFLDLIHRHRVAYTFAPNFFLASLWTHLEESTTLSQAQWDLGCLRCLVSGGEANVVDTCVALARRLAEYKAAPNCIMPAFGMTETCAGITYHKNFPEYDLGKDHEFACLGTTVKGAQIRVTSLTDGTPVDDGVTVGNLECSGKIIFKGYYNNPRATNDAFTPDEWFSTGDLATLDSDGRLTLRGRSKDMVCINGVKYLPQEIENAVESSDIPGVTPSFTVCFSYRPPKAQTEQLVIAYLPSYGMGDVDGRLQAQDELTRVGLIMTGSRPYVLPLDAKIMSKSSLGKISRNKIKIGLENGAFKDLQEINETLIKSHRASHVVGPSTPLEKVLLQAVLEALPLSEDEVGVTTSLYNAGITSIHLIKMKQHMEKVLQRDIPTVLMMTSSTVREFATRLEESKSGYDPVVTLQPNGQKTPLWLIHPVAGEVLVFVQIASLFSDRPVHALRARGLDAGQKPFATIHEAATTYYEGIKRKQPQGPYAVVGYSYGSLLGFEVAKRLDQNGDEVKFFGSLDLPPFHGEVISQSSWTLSLLHLASSISIIPEETMGTLEDELRGLSQDETIQQVIRLASPDRLAELGMDATSLMAWTHVSYAMTQATRGYEPNGQTSCIDAFYTEPSSGLGMTKAKWLAKHHQWAQFGRFETRFHELQGLHYRLFDEENVHAVYKVLTKAMAARGV
ncbi:hypothetical protein BDV59DRAFT_198692 [Aspergillus ambiguus]|uniref:non-ribosomal peptide synthetase n=1 Tax=Aspergillus ambiguus TaxID=176160 RepID=UPI003CCD341C